jgi:hypothetical protein
MHVDAPVTQDVTPLRQIDGLAVHAWLAVHDTQVPVPLHTWFVPQVVPAAVLPLSTHFGAPEAQSMTPVLHGEPGLVVQAVPAAHVTHCPLPLHTMFDPQAMPAVALSPSTQPEADPHATTPSLQGLPGLVVQTVPAAQLVHVPDLQTLSEPHDKPSGTLASSWHCGAPVVQATAPFLQGLPGFVEQSAPVAHGMHVPAALQTWPVPQVAPGLFAVPFMQPTGSQTMVPLRHWSLLVSQAVPAVQLLQTPSTHSMLLPQAVPSFAFGPSLHVRLSEPHSIRPSTHGQPGLVMHASGVQVTGPSTPPSSRPPPTAASTMPPI